MAESTSECVVSDCTLQTHGHKEGSSQIVGDTEFLQRHNTTHRCVPWGTCPPQESGEAEANAIRLRENMNTSQ